MDPDLPDGNAWSKYVKKHPEFAAKLQEVYHRMPYSFQLNVRLSSPRLRIDRERPRAAGMVSDKIAKALGVPLYTVRRIYRELKNEARQKKHKK